MDQDALVAGRVESGLRLVRAMEPSVPVGGALWIREPEQPDWRFYLATRLVEEGRIEFAYRELARVTAEPGGPAINAFDVRLVGVNDPVSRDLVEAYAGRPRGVPIVVNGGSLGGIEIEQAILVRGPGGGNAMPSGRETLERIIDEEASFFQQHGTSPRRMKLPVLMAYDLAKCGRDELGELSGRVFKDGITVFEREGFHGMSVEIVRDRNAALAFE